MRWLCFAEKLSSMTDIPLRDTLLYRLAPQLFRHEPIAFAAMLESQSFAHIEASRILPALLHCRGTAVRRRSREFPRTSSGECQGSLPPSEEGSRTREEERGPEKRADRSANEGLKPAGEAEGRQDLQDHAPKPGETSGLGQGGPEARDKSDTRAKQDEEAERSCMVRRECGMELVEYFARQVAAMKGGSGGWTAGGGGRCAFVASLSVYMRKHFGADTSFSLNLSPKALRICV